MGNFGAMDEDFEDQSRDMERLSEMNVSDLARPLPEGLDLESFDSRGNPDLLQPSRWAFGRECNGDNSTSENIPAGSSDANDARLDRMVSDALVHASMSGLKLPWEEGPFAIVFREDTMQTLPVVEQSFSLADNPGEKSFGTSATLQSTKVVVSKRTYFDHAVSMKSGKTKALKYQSQVDLMNWRFEALVSMDHDASSVGGKIKAMKWADRVNYVGQCLAGRSLNTLKKRYGQVCRYVRYVNKEFFQMPFPFDDDVLKPYMSHIAKTSSHSVLSGFIEVVAFMEHVLGFIVPNGFYNDPWTKGTLRGMKMARKPRRQSRTLKVSELQHLETFLADKTKSLVDRFAVGAMLFAVYSRARVGDLAAVQCVSIDVCQSGGAYKGYIEARSLSHKMKISSSGLGLNLPLVAPIDGVGSRQWGIDFWEVSIEAGLPLNALQPGSPMFPAPGVTGEWTTRPITPTEVKKWLHLILAELPSFDPTDLTAHGLKSTTLAMMARYGLSPTTRLILGHHSMKGLSSLETYSRDAQASPLREYESMMEAIRGGTYVPDATRSGLMVSKPVMEDTSKMFPSAARVVAGGGANLQALVQDNEDPSLEDDLEDVEPDGPDEGASDSTESSSSSSDSSTDDEPVIRYSSSADDVFEWKVGCKNFQHKRTKAIHAKPDGGGTAFLCGRKLSTDHVELKGNVFSREWLCQQCDKGKPIRTLDGMADAFDRAVKRIKPIT